MAHRKLQQEVDRIFKKINEGVEVFDQLHERHEMADNPVQREKLETDLKKEVKKLQKLREQVKVWQASTEVKDKESLLVYRRKVEVAMESYKEVERGSKVKAYSNTSLRSGIEMDPAEREKLETIEFIQETIEELERQYQVAEAELEKLLSKKGKKASSANAAEKEELKEIQVRYRWHQQQLELALRLLENDELDYTEVGEVKEEIEYFLQHNRDSDFVDNEYIYESLDLESNAVVQKEIVEGYGQYVDELASSPSPAKQSREATPSSASMPTPKSKKILTSAVPSVPTSANTAPSSASPSLVSSSLRPAAPPVEEVKWSKLTSPAEAEAERLREQEEAKRLEREELERKERLLKEKEDRERHELEEREERERAARNEREKRELEEAQAKEAERLRREKEREDREREKREREELEAIREFEERKEKEKKRQKRLQSLGLDNRDLNAGQIIITGSSPAVLKRLEEKIREEEEIEKEEPEEVVPLQPLDETLFRTDSELLYLPPGLQDVVCSYYAARRTNDKIVSSVAQSVRPPREYLPENVVPSLSSCIELTRAANVWAIVRPKLASFRSSTPSSPLASPQQQHHQMSPSPAPASPAVPGVVPQTVSATHDILKSVDIGTLFYAFYYSLTPFEINAVEQELIKRQWRADTVKHCWYLRSMAPIQEGSGFEVANYRKFDSASWTSQELLNYKLDYSTLSPPV